MRFWCYINCPSTLFLIEQNKEYEKLLLLNFTTKKVSQCSIHGQLPFGEIDKCLESQNIYIGEVKRKA